MADDDITVTIEPAGDHAETTGAGDDAVAAVQAQFDELKTRTARIEDERTAALRLAQAAETKAQEAARERDAVRALGYPESFLRMWEFYLCYCEGGFEERVISDAQLLFAKPGNRSPR